MRYFSLQLPEDACKKRQLSRIADTGIVGSATRSQCRNPDHKLPLSDQTTHDRFDSFSRLIQLPMAKTSLDLIGIQKSNQFLS